VVRGQAARGPSERSPFSKDAGEYCRILESLARSSVRPAPGFDWHAGRRGPARRVPAVYSHRGRLANVGSRISSDTGNTIRLSRA
jgi:hypothetical protein